MADRTKDRIDDLGRTALFAGRAVLWIIVGLIVLDNVWITVEAASKPGAFEADRLITSEVVIALLSACAAGVAVPAAVAVHGRYKLRRAEVARGGHASGT